MQQLRDAAIAAIPIADGSLCRYLRLCIRVYTSLARLHCRTPPFEHRWRHDSPTSADVRPLCYPIDFAGRSDILAYEAFGPRGVYTSKKLGGVGEHQSIGATKDGDNQKISQPDSVLIAIYPPHFMRFITGVLTFQIRN